MTPTHVQTHTHMHTHMHTHTLTQFQACRMRLTLPVHWGRGRWGGAGVRACVRGGALTVTQTTTRILPPILAHQQGQHEDGDG